MGFSRQEYCSGLPCLPPGNLPNPRIEDKSLTSPALASGFFTTSATWDAPTNKDWLSLVVLCSVAELCLTLCKPMNCNPPDSSVHGNFQSRVLERVAISSSRDLPDPGMEPVSLASLALQVGSLPLVPPVSLKPEIDYFGTLSKILISINSCF